MGVRPGSVGDPFPHALSVAARQKRSTTAKARGKRFWCRENARGTQRHSKPAKTAFLMRRPWRCRANRTYQAGVQLEDEAGGGGSTGGCGDGRGREAASGEGGQAGTAEADRLSEGKGGSDGVDERMRAFETANREALLCRSQSEVDRLNVEGDGRRGGEVVGVVAGVEDADGVRARGEAGRGMLSGVSAP